MRYRPALAALSLASLAALFALASPAAAAPPARTFHDRDRLVEATPLPADDPAHAPLTAHARGLTPVLLRYEGRARPVPALVDRTAIVRLDPGADAELAALGARLVRPLMPSIGLHLVEDTTGADGIDLARRLQPAAPRAHGIRAALPNLHLRRKPHGEYIPDDPRYSGQWYFDNLRMPLAWDLWRGDPGTSIVVVDTGCDLAHADLVEKLDPGLDLVDGDDDPSPDTSENGAAHGTACAGLVAASTNNAEGIAGACPECRMRCVRLITDKPVPISADVEAFELAFETDAAVVSNSWGFVDAIPVPSMLADAIDNVFDNGRGGRGALVLFAMGNDDREVGDDELQAVRGVLGIGAINNFDDKTPFTNFGACTDLVAPTGTLTTDITGPAGDDASDYTSLFGGTSSACPVAAGIAALLASAAPELTSAQLADILIQTARPAPYAVPDAEGHDPVFGHGIVDPVSALQHALGTGEGGAGAGGEGGAGAGGAGGAGGGSDDPEGDCTCAVPGAGAVPGTGALAHVVSLCLALARRRRRP